MPKEVTVAGVTVDPVTKSPIVVLREPESGNVVPIWIGLLEANAIALALEGTELPRPMTHDLMKSILHATGTRLRSVEIAEIRESTYFALLHIEGDGESVHVDARPSDAIALALRAKCPIFVAEGVIQKARRVDLSAQEAITSEDAKKWTEILEGLDPSDFGKYKM